MPLVWNSSILFLGQRLFYLERALNSGRDTSPIYQKVKMAIQTWFCYITKELRNKQQTPLVFLLGNLVNSSCCMLFVLRGVT